MSYRSTTRKKPIEPPWGRARRFARGSASAAEASLIDAGLRKVASAEWRGERDGHPFRVVLSHLTLRTKVEVALGSAPRLDLETFRPVGEEQPFVGAVGVASSQPELAQAILEEAQQGLGGEPPYVMSQRIIDRVIRIRLSRGKEHLRPEEDALYLEPYGPVVWAVEYALGLGRALEAHGEGESPFEET